MMGRWLSQMAEYMAYLSDARGCLEECKFGVDGRAQSAPPDNIDNHPNVILRQ